MILKKNITDDSVGCSRAALLGLKVIGGSFTESGRLGAVIDKVKKGSIADTVGRLRSGDEVLEWNGRSLRDKTYEEVWDIIAESKQEPQVELIVSRPIRRINPPIPFNFEASLNAKCRMARRFTDANISIRPHSKNGEQFYPIN